MESGAGFLRKNPGRRQQAANKPQSMIEFTHQHVTLMKYPLPVTTDYLAQIFAPAPPPVPAPRLRPESMILTPPERRIGTIFEESELSPAPPPILSAGGTPVKMRSKIRTSPRSRPLSLPVRPQPIPSEAIITRMNGVETDL